MVDGWVSVRMRGYRMDGKKDRIQDTVTNIHTPSARRGVSFSPKHLRNIEAIPFRFMPSVTY